jgi:hypothetical protein
MKKVVYTEKLKVKGYTNIPFRVIIYEILCYLEVWEKDIKKYYGYFEKDYKRKKF